MYIQRLIGKALYTGMNFSHHFYLPVKVKAQSNYGRSLKVRLTTLLNTYVPTKTLRVKKNLPLVTQEMRRKMNQRDHLYQVQKNTEKENEPTGSPLPGTEKYWEGRGPTKF